MNKVPPKSKSHANVNANTISNNTNRIHFKLRKLLAKPSPAKLEAKDSADIKKLQIQYYLRLETESAANNSIRSASSQAKHSSSSPAQAANNTEKEIFLNTLLGKQIKLVWQGEIRCVHCNRLIKKTFNAGYCYPCFRSLAQNDLCQVRPELCHFHNKTCRDASWAKNNCFIPHSLYLSYTSDLKVGITRSYRLWTRWADQGAEIAMPLIQIPSRLDAGRAETIFKKFFKDTSYYKTMLENNFLDTHARRNLQLSLKERLKAGFTENLEKFYSHAKALDPFPENTLEIQEEPKAEIYALQYPSLENASLNASLLSFEKNPVLLERLIGIRAQYLIFERGLLNVRKFAGYCLQIQY